MHQDSCSTMKPCKVRKAVEGRQPPAPRRAIRRLPASSSLVRATRERMRGRLRLGDHLVDLTLPLEAALDRFLHRPTVEAVASPVALLLPVDDPRPEDAPVV